MKIEWKNKRRKLQPAKPGFEVSDEATSPPVGSFRAQEPASHHPRLPLETLEENAITLAEGGKYREALAVFDEAVGVAPDKASLHEYRAQVLMELGDMWQAVKAATRATELAPHMSELNFGEPQLALESFEAACAKDNSVQAEHADVKLLVLKRLSAHGSVSARVGGDTFCGQGIIAAQGSGAGVSSRDAPMCLRAHVYEPGLPPKEPHDDD
eukprot:jgi/Mesvir1/17122/Mv07555-RA.1